MDDEVDIPTLTMWVIYECPLDYPHAFVARRWEVRGIGAMVATEEVRVAATLEGVRERIPPYLYRLDRNPDDEPQIVEVWI